jgi:hypothetical protein
MLERKHCIGHPLGVIAWYAGTTTITLWLLMHGVHKCLALRLRNDVPTVKLRWHRCGDVKGIHSIEPWEGRPGGSECFQ